MMAEPALTCDRVDEQQLDTRYLSGRLSEAEDADFEAHFFGCDRCWELVKGGAAVQAALAAEPVQPAAVRGKISGRRSRTWWQPLAIAAGLTLAAVATWRLIDTGSDLGIDGLRGTRDSIAVSTQVAGADWDAAWSVAPGTSFYRLRLFNADGQLLLEREVSDTSFSLPSDSLEVLRNGAALYLEIQAFDPVRRPVARSSLIPIPGPGAG